MSSALKARLRRVEGKTMVRTPPAGGEILFLAAKIITDDIENPLQRRGRRRPMSKHPWWPQELPPAERTAAISQVLGKIIENVSNPEDDLEPDWED